MNSSWIFGALGLCLCLQGCDDSPRLALGTYRVPYEDGTVAMVTRDFDTHTTPKDGMYDLRATSPPAAIVAAAPGWVRRIDQGNQEPTETNNFVWIEHPFPYCQDPADEHRFNFEGRPGGRPENYDDWCISCSEDFCNEWTVYAHMETSSVSDAGVGAGDWVEAGQVIGIESNIGQIQGQDPNVPGDGRHLHFHVAIIDPFASSDNGYYEDWSNGAWYSSPELEARVCLGLFGEPPFSYYRDGESVTAGPCDEDRSLGPNG